MKEKIQMLVAVLKTMIPTTMIIEIYCIMSNTNKNKSKKENKGRVGGEEREEEENSKNLKSWKKIY